MSSMRAIVASTSLLCALVGCSAKPIAPPSTPHLPKVEWVGTLGRDHPLVGRFWNPSTGAFVEPDAVLQTILAAHVVLLGEKHDDVDHHALQAAVVRAMIAGGRHPAIAFEMFDTDKQPIVDAAKKSSPHDVLAFARAVEWEKSGWPPFAIYQPVFAAAFDADLAIVAANQPRAQSKALVKTGLGALDPAEVTALGLDKPLPPADQASLHRELVDAHCGMIPETSPVIDGMILAERGRDATMARRLHEAGLSGGLIDGAVLIAGSGHARKDRGVPSVLRALGEKGPVLSIGFLEVEKTQLEPAAYAARFSTDTLPFDLVVFTPIASDEDPCAGMGK